MISHVWVQSNFYHFSPASDLSPAWDAHLLGEFCCFWTFFLCLGRGRREWDKIPQWVGTPFDCCFFRGFLTKFLHRLDLNHPERLFEAFSCTTCDDFSEISGVRSVTLKAFFKT